MPRTPDSHLRRYGAHRPPTGNGAMRLAVLVLSITAFGLILGYILATVID